MIMEYKLISAKQEQVKLSEDRKTFSIDYTVTGEAIDSDIILPINTGITISNIPLSLGEEIPNFAETKVVEWFNNKYISK